MPTLGGIVRDVLKLWRQERLKKGSRLRARWSRTTAVLKQKSAIELARDCGMGMSNFPVIRSAIDGFACLHSILLIHVLLHRSQTTFAFQSRPLATRSSIISPF